MLGKVTEKNFPRGGKKPAVVPLKKRGFNLFGKKTLSKNKKAKQRIISKKGVRSKTGELKKSYTTVDKTVKKLVYKDLIEGMVLLGCIKEVREYDLSVNLPGCLVAKVPVTNVSGIYTSVLQSLTEGKSPEGAFYKLKEMFVEGQYVVCKVVQVRHADSGGHKVVASLDPHELHSDCPPASLAVRGVVLTTAVKSAEEHGYVMETGMPGVRAFLKKDLAREYETVWNSGKPLGLGQLVRCVIIKTVCAGNVTTVSLSAVPNSVAAATQDETPLHCLLPGALINVTISKVLKNGLCVMYEDDKVGYVPEKHLSTPGSKLKSYAVGSILGARLLYILPVIRTAYFSLDNSILSADLPVSPFTVIHIGDIILKAKVTGVDANGISIRFGKKSRGLRALVSTFRVRKELSQNPEIPLIKKLESLYPIGSRQKCKVLGYDYMEKIFFCTFEKDIVENKAYGINALSLGQKVHCIAQKVGKNGLVVQVVHGKQLFDATVPPLHMSDVPLQHPEKKFTAGLKLKGKVLSLRDDKLRITVKPSLVSSKLTPLTQLDDVRPGLECEGVVVHITDKGALVAFYGDARGWLPANKISSEPVNPKDVFYLGQVVHCYVDVVYPEDKRVTLSLLQGGKSVGNKKVKFGSSYNLIVKDAQPDGLRVSVEGLTAVEGMVPLHHMSEDSGFQRPLLKTFQPGEVLNGALCCVEGSKPQFTLRKSLSEYFNWWLSRTEKTVGWEALKKDLIVPGVVTKVDEKGISVQLILPGLHNSFFVPAEQLSDIINTIPQLGIQKDQIIQIKIMRIAANKKKIVLSAKVSQCWDGKIQEGVTLLASYLQDRQKIMQNLLQLGKPLGQLKPGMLIDGRISAVSQWGALLKLSNGVRAIVVPYHYPPNIKMEIGAVVTGKIIVVNAGRNCVDVSLHPGIMDRIPSNQDYTRLEAGWSVRAETLLVKPEHVVVSLRGVGLHCLAFVPTRRHINDFLPFTCLFELGKVSKVVLQQVERDFIIAMPKVLVLKPHLLMQNNISNNNMFKISGPTESESLKRTCAKEDTDSENNILPTKIKSDGSIINEIEVNEIDSQIISSSDKKEKKSSKRKNSFGDLSDSEIIDIGKKVKRESKDFSTKDTSSVALKVTKKEDITDYDANENSHIEEGLSNYIKSDDEDSVQPTKPSTFRFSDVDIKPLGAGSTFVWNADPCMLPAAKAAHIQSESSSDDEDNKVNSKKRRKLTAAERRELAHQEEESLREAERRLADSQFMPQSADDFDRLVLASPNSSICWIKYMAFHLQATEIEKARSVALRALKTISFREETEKFNVWVALLNLESLYGTKESLAKVLEDALQSNEPSKVYWQMLQIYADSGKLQELDMMIGKVTKCYSDNKEMWLHACGVLMRLGQLDKARSLFQKALSRLDKKQHVDMISRFAHLENKYGSPERAETLMEQILASYPKRVDVWMSYFNMLVKRLSTSSNLLQRIIAHQLPPRKMKPVFNMFLQFEEQHGTPEGLEEIRQLAKNYMDGFLATTDSVTED